MIGLGKPVMAVPAMHANMMETVQYREVSTRLSSSGILLVPPKIEEGIAKYPDPYLIGRIASAYITRGSDLRGLKILVTAGPTREWLDPVRFISNPSSGRMGVEIAVEAWSRGAEVILVHGPLGVEPPHMVRRYRVETTGEMRKVIEKILDNEKVDVVIASAAPVDFKPSLGFKEKLKSGERLSLELIPTPKVIEGLKDKVSLLVAFAAETVSDREKLIMAAREKMEKYRADIIVANRVGSRDAGFAVDVLDALLIWRKGGKLLVEDLSRIKKEIVASRLLDTVKIVLEGEG
jgi:phosphopantothenoylcysteine decarboxylase/phosphopantothenate--cysteine ligase